VARGQCGTGVRRGTQASLLEGQQVVRDGVGRWGFGGGLAEVENPQM